MKSKLLIILLAFANFLFCQSINHKPIPGTKYSIIPPEGFVASTSFSGFQHVESGASIMVTEIPAPVETMIENFTADALKTKGMTLIDKQTIDFNNSKASFIKLSQQANGQTYLKQILVFGDSKKTVLVNGIYPEAGKSIEVYIKTSLLSTSYNENQNDDFSEAVKFKIDVSGTDFKFAKFISGNLMYSKDGKVTTGKPTLIAGTSISKVATENQKQYCIERLKKLPGVDLNKVKGINPIEIDNLKGYEIVAYGKNKVSKEELVYQAMLFNDMGDYFIIIGMAAEEFDNNLDTFRKIAKTFKRK